MSPGTTALLVVGWLSATVLAWRRRAVDDHQPARMPSVSVVIPARDEERTLPRLLASLAAQAQRPREVLVVDDGSTDATAAVATAGGATVLPAPPPPPGWAGKPWACHLGVEATTGERLVFLDADTALAPDGLGRLVAAHDALAPGGLLSVQPHHDVERPHEQLSLFCNVVPVLAAGMLLPRRPADAALAFGPCLVTAAADLHAVGGFGAVRGELFEDAALARAYRSAGRPVRSLLGGRTVRFRMYPHGLGQLAEGWTKNLAGGAGHAPKLPTLGAVLWVAALAALALEAAVRPSPAVAAAWVVTTLQLAWLARRVGTFRWWSVAAFPVPLLWFVALFVRSAVAHRVHGRVRWRGRELPARSR